ncbi:MAG: hypothetical protein P8017_02885 [Deltaproteobacteria bacterium]
MKRILLLICALLLLADLADDGYIGKAPHLAPHCPGTISLTSSPDISDNIAPQVWIPLEKELGLLRPWNNQWALIEAYDFPSIINSYLYYSSSGGLPL